VGLHLPYNEIAYTARNGRTLDIKVINMGTREVRQLSFGEGDNESPAWAPNGRHLAFWCRRAAGKKQIFTMSGDGKNVRQIHEEREQLIPRLVQIRTMLRLRTITSTLLVAALAVAGGQAAPSPTPDVGNGTPLPPSSDSPSSCGRAADSCWAWHQGPPEVVRRAGASCRYERRP